MRIPYVNLSAQNIPFIDCLMSRVKEIIQSGIYINGNEVTEFERNICEYIDVKYSIGVNSGTDALMIAMLALNIGPGDEVITVSNSFIATAAAIHNIGAKVVFCDVDDNQLIKLNKIENLITEHTKAIIPVHFAGKPVNMDKLMKIATKNNLYVIEDSAQAIGASINGKKVGQFGDIGAFSLHPLKNLGACGDAGFITTNSEQLYERMKRLRNHGLINRDECLEFGWNSRLDTLQAAILNVKLEYLDKWNNRRREIASMYINALSGCPVKLPSEEEGVVSVYHAFVIQVENRNKLINYLYEKGVETKVHYPIPIHLQEAYIENENVIDLCETTKQSDMILSLPVYPELSNAEVKYIIDSILEFYFVKGE